MCLTQKFCYFCSFKYGICGVNFFSDKSKQCNPLLVSSWLLKNLSVVLFAAKPVPYAQHCAEDFQHTASFRVNNNKTATEPT